MNGKLNERAMLVSLNISVWTARKYDKKVSDEVANTHNATKQAGRYNKNLLPVNAESFKAIQVQAGVIRVLHYANTLPWGDDNIRILLARNFFDYTQKMRAEKQTFSNLVQQFLAEYPMIKQKAIAALNGMANANDYPSEADLAESFDCSTKFLPFPDSGDFRLELEADELNAIKQQLEENTKNAIETAMQDVFTRLHSVVKKMGEKLADTDAIFRDSLVNNIEELCTVVPRLNLTDSPELQALTKQIQTELIVDPDSLRHSKTQRSSIAAKAKALESQLAGYIGVSN